MGDVYAAYDPELDRNIAIKLLRSGTTSQSDEGRARLMREAQAIARVSHPNVVVVPDAGTFQDRVFIAMEFVEGHTLGHWMHARSRTWPEVLEVFSAAGRGLAAAHACDLVHRDFKPDNVMISADGQVRVMDFGLVQVAGDRRKVVGDETALTTFAAPLTGDVSRDADREVTATRIVGGLSVSTRGGQVSGRQAPLLNELTQTGATIGTPAYMSPEQFRGEPTDASTDQFSFCVALYEALYGERPFAGRDLLELSKNVSDGLVQDPPAGTRVPFWIREVLLRGLQARANARWPSMNSLLAELEKQPAMASRRRFATAAAARLTEVWEPPKGDRPVETSAKAEIRRAFQSTGKVYAAQSFERASRILDQYTQRWSALYVEACEATHVRGEQSAEVLDLRMACLHEGLNDLKALCRMFQQPTAEVVENAVNAANALRGLDRCENVELLRALVRPPEDAGTRAAVEQLRIELAEVRALSRVGRVNEGLAAVAPLEQEARTLEYEPLLVDTLMVVGVLHADNGGAEMAARAFEEALWTAVQCRHEEAVAEAATWLVGLIGTAPPDRGAGEIWNRFAEAFLRRMGGHDLVWGWLYTNRAAMRESQGRLLEALDDARLSVAAKENALGPDHPDLGYSIGNMSLYLVGLGQLDEAVEYARRAVEIVEGGLGPNHLLSDNYISPSATITSPHPERRR